MERRTNSVLALLSIPLFLVVSLSACTTTAPDGESASSSSLSSASSTTSSSPRMGALEGEFCGGIAGIICAENLRCQYDGDYPDAGGICVR